MITATVTFVELPDGKIAVAMTSESVNRTERERMTASVYDKAFDAAFRAISEWIEVSQSSYASGGTLEQCIKTSMENAFGNKVG